jgi:hypothetical protein
MVSSYPSSPSSAEPPSLSAIAPRAAAPLAADTGIAKPVAGRSSVASTSPTRAASPPPEGTTIDVVAVIANGAPVPGTTDAGLGTTAWAPSLARGAEAGAG